MSANVRAEIEKRLKRKRTEVANLESERDGHLQAAEQLAPKIEAGNSIINELQSLLNLYDKTEETHESGTQTEIALRRDSDMWNAREALRRLGQPTHIARLVVEMGRTDDLKTRSSIAGQLGWYVRKGQHFTRPEPNTFGLKEWETSGAGPQGQTSGEDKDDPEVLPLTDADLGVRG